MVASAVGEWHWLTQVRGVTRSDSSRKGTTLPLFCLASAARFLMCPSAKGCRFMGNKCRAHASYESGAHTPMTARVYSLITIV